MTTTAIDPYAVADGIGKAWGAWLERDARPPTPRPYVYASSWRVCLRRAVYDAAIPGAAPAWPAETLARFRRGADRERDLLVDLQRVGRDAAPPFAVVGQQERFTLRDHKGRTAIVGKVDARIQIGQASAPLEIKAWSPFVVDKIETFADLFDQPWTQAGAYQLLSYLFGAGEPVGFLLLDRSGLPKIVPVELERYLDRVEDFLTRAEAVVDHLEAGTLPDYHDDAAECRRCPYYGAVCNPPIEGAVIKLLIDPELEAGLARWHAGKDQGKAWRELDDEIKARLRGVEAGIVGPFAIKGTWGKSSRVELPPAIKAQYTKTNPRGRFTLEITKL